MSQTRWEQGRAQERAEGLGGYGAHFAQLIADGADVEGEARLADALVGRGAAILDAGSGMGRVGAALVRRGHRVVGVDFDPELLAQSQATYPELPVVASRLDELTPDRLSAAGQPDVVRPRRVCRQRDGAAGSRHRAHGARPPSARCSLRMGGSWSGSA